MVLIFIKTEMIFVCYIACMHKDVLKNVNTSCVINDQLMYDLCY